MPESTAEYWAMDPARRADRLAGIVRTISRQHAEALDLIAVMDEADRSSTDELAKDWTVEEIAAALRVSPGTAADWLHLARAMRAMPRLMALLRDGAITIMHARVAVREMRQVDPVRYAAVFDRVLRRAPSQTVGQFAAAVRRAVLAVAADDAVAQHERALDDRRVCSRPAAHGMADMYACVSGLDAAAIMQRVDDEARKVIPGDTRTLEQRRADAYVALLLGAQPGQPAPVRGEVGLVVNASTVAGLDDEPGELSGHGPIPAELARRIAYDPTNTWRRILVNDSGALLDYGRRTYRPPARLDRQVRARDRHCRFPSCTRSPARAELDHITAWKDGGHTKPDNLQALCTRHHHVKTRQRLEGPLPPGRDDHLDQPQRHRLPGPAQHLPGPAQHLPTRPNGNRA